MGGRDNAFYLVDDADRRSPMGALDLLLYLFETGQAMGFFLETERPLDLA